MHSPLLCFALLCLALLSLLLFSLLYPLPFSLLIPLPLLRLFPCRILRLKTRFDRIQLSTIRRLIRPLLFLLLLPCSLCLFVCCLLSLASYLLSLISCLLSPVSCLLPLASCLLSLLCLCVYVCLSLSLRDNRGAASGSPYHELNIKGTSLCHVCLCVVGMFR